MHAACYDNPACLKLLLPLSDPNAQDDNGKTALMYALGHGAVKCGKLLLPVSDLNIKNREGNTALMHAKKEYRGGETLPLLEQAHAELEQRHLDESIPKAKAAPKVKVLGKKAL
jgi:ankyrin repeat protein